MIEFTQALLERRKGGESGVCWIEATEGDAVRTHARTHARTIDRSPLRFPRCRDFLAALEIRWHCSVLVFGVLLGLYV